MKLGSSRTRAIGALVVGVVVLVSPLLTACKKKLIHQAPGMGPGTYLVNSMKEGEDVSRWTVEFSHEEGGTWVSDSTVSMSQKPVLVVDKFRLAYYWPKAGNQTTQFRIQVWNGKSLLDEMTLAREAQR